MIYFIDIKFDFVICLISCMREEGYSDIMIYIGILVGLLSISFEFFLELVEKRYFFFMGIVSFKFIRVRFVICYYLVRNSLRIILILKKARLRNGEKEERFGF